MAHAASVQLVPPLRFKRSETHTTHKCASDPHLLSDERAAVKNDLSDTERALGATHSALPALASAWLTLPVGGGSMDLQGQ